MTALPKHPPSEPEHLYRPKAGRHSSFEELDVVELTNPATTFDGKVVAAGTVGTIVTVWDHGTCFDVEFPGPFGLASVGPGDLKRHI